MSFYFRLTLFYYKYYGLMNALGFGINSIIKEEYWLRRILM